MRLQDLKDDLKGTREEMHELKHTAKAAEKELGRQQQMVETAVRERDRFKRRNTQLARKFKGAMGDNTKLRRLLDSTRQKLSQASKQLAISLNKCELSTTDNYHLENELRITRERIATLQVKLFRQYNEEKARLKKQSGGGLANLSMMLAGKKKKKKKKPASSSSLSLSSKTASPNASLALLMAKKKAPPPAAAKLAGTDVGGGDDGSDGGGDAFGFEMEESGPADESGAPPAGNVLGVERERGRERERERQ